MTKSSSLASNKTKTNFGTLKCASVYKMLSSSNQASSGIKAATNETRVAHWSSLYPRSHNTRRHERKSTQSERGDPLQPQKHMIFHHIVLHYVRRINHLWKESFIASRLTALKNKSENSKLCTASVLTQDHVQKRWKPTLFD